MLIKCHDISVNNNDEFSLKKGSKRQTKNGPYKKLHLILDDDNTIELMD
jgi:hypothetical protein